MKHLLLVALLLATSARADSPDAILKDYRKQATQAVERLNQSLEKAVKPLGAQLVKDGDTAGAEQLTKEMHAKIAGEAVAAPQASAASLFGMYDEARAKALAPVQKASIARIDSLLKIAGGAKLETVTELGNVRTEIEAGKVSDDGESSLPTKWFNMSKAAGRSEIRIVLNPGGMFSIDDGKVKKTGTWMRSAEKGMITIQMKDGDTWTAVITGRLGILFCGNNSYPITAK